MIILVCMCTLMRRILHVSRVFFVRSRPRFANLTTRSADCHIIFHTTCLSPSPSSEPKTFFPYALHSLYQIPGTIANFFALYLPPNSFLYLRSFFLAQTAICPTAIAMNRAVLQCLLTIKIATQASDSKV